MIHMPKKLDLTKSSLSIDLVIKRISNLLDRHMLVGLGVESRTETIKPHSPNQQQQQQTKDTTKIELQKNIGKEKKKGIA